jgi:hypothetical protein
MGQPRLTINIFTTVDRKDMSEARTNKLANWNPAPPIMIVILMTSILKDVTHRKKEVRVE